MDVKPVPAPTVPSRPVMDILPPDPVVAAPPLDKADTDKLPLTLSKDKPAIPKPKSPPHSGSNVTVAIIATVVIVIGLAMLAVYAYLKTNK